MSLSTRFLSLRYKLKPALNKVRKESAIPVTTPDKVQLLTDIYFPQGEGPFATILIRTAYKRSGFANYARLYAERGFITVLQACRGTDGSGGQIGPLLMEREDGLATLDWLKQQKWFDGRLGMSGPSYLGYVQWAICDALPQKSALSTQIAASDYRNALFPQGSINLQFWLSWMQLSEGLRTSPLRTMLRALTGSIERSTRRAANQLPLIDADIAATGHKVEFWRRWMLDAIKHEEHWQSISHTKRLGVDTPPNFFISGWYDFILNDLLEDYQILRANGHTPYLTIGPWFHVDPKLIGESVRSTLAFMRANLLDDRSELRKKPVRLFISGLDQWREYETFPPPGQNQFTNYLAPGNALATAPDKTALPARYRYDPTDPTPNVGGAVFAFNGAGAHNNARLEARSDVITFTTAPLETHLTLIGQPQLTLFASSSLERTDFFARLCDVDPNERSTNICDGFVRITPDGPARPENGIFKLNILLHNRAHQFLAGHRLRLQVSSGAHPRFSRNPGTIEKIDQKPEMLCADQSIFFDSDHPSALSLPVYQM